MDINYNTELIQKEGKLYYLVEGTLIEASLTDITKHYKAMQYNLMWLIGMYVTDRPDLVIDPKEVLYLAEYTPIPENAFRIK